MSNSHKDKLVALREAFLAHVRALIAQYPAQATNEAYYLHRAAIAQLGSMRRAVATKGNFSTYAIGDEVLVWPPAWAMASDAEVWHPRNSCCTVVDKHAVQVVS